ncbi:MAG: DUF1540 domain-containing protein [Defluviitaleaceae bacterium]|nr:DUF1540 domain-containing protein [Defluviitaleaceae bacterium]
MINPHIKCSVRNCKFNDRSKHCSLDTIEIGNSSPSPHEKRETECDSFEDGTPA